MSKAMKLGAGSIAVGLVVLGLKLLAWVMTGSVALLSDALESTVNVVTAVAALVAIHYASQPADANHPYGHHKAELFSAILEGVMIIVAALLIMKQAYEGLMAPRVLEAPIAGILVNAGASVLNGIWCWVLIHQGRKHRSPALVADGKHLLSDVVSSVVVALGVLLALETGWTWADPALAGLVALNILWSGWKVMRQSLSGLLDESLSEEVLAEVRRVIGLEAVGAVEAHDLRTRAAGPATFIEFHLVVKGEMTVIEAHEMCDRVEAALKALIEGCVITIHVEPEHKAKHSGIVVL
ncbi:cation diffusion facilitator family transporter [Stagnihabitans tardus]|uniref:Cation diffusion facilitator family transporter n=1 Tax=Stagnihabitans tardus TaxID=2699202 RepID=A0AAE4Y7Z6_9RHOB|nr:cation diffusion facilitator family transporter [Stagnihabitans tardus]NBZ87571.1 cation diffusion facilitator family transporter [Stagnihabitans tardus]